MVGIGQIYRKRGGNLTKSYPLLFWGMIMGNAVTNTAERAKTNPLGMLLDAMAGGPDNAIERMEAAGQAELCMSDVLPSRGIEKVREMIESAGGSIGSLVHGDTIFVNVTLPAGWKKRSTDHSMWSELIDDKGRRRAGIFYKAAFYDRSAHISPDRRFSYDLYSHEITADGELTANITDACGLVEYAITRKIDMNDEERSRQYKLRDRVGNELRVWLSENWPNWQDCSAYWD
jgi:hypothetical protein